MPQSQKPDLQSIANQLTGGPPMSFKCYPDNTLIVIDHEGKKRRFSYDQYKSLLTPKKAASKKKK